MGKWTNYMEGGSQSINNADQWLPEEEKENIVSAGNFTPDSYVPEGAVNNYQPAPVEPEWDPESGLPAPRAWDIHYKPSWFVEEQTNRKNPTYTPDSNWSNEEVDAIANYVNGMKKNHPDEWKYGDPGWDTSTQLWQETIKPLEDQYAAVQKKKQEEERIAQQQLQANQPQAGQDSQYYAYHNNNVQTFTPNEEGILSQDQIDAIKANSPYRIHKVDTSAADYESLSRSGKTNFNIMPGTAGTDVKNRKWYQRFSQPVLGAVMSASGPATIAKLAFTALGGPVGLAYGIAWGATAGYSYLKGANVIKGNDTVDKIIELTDIMDKKGAQAQAALAYGFEKAGGGDWTDWSKSEENLDFLLKNFSTIMHYAFGEERASSEYNSDVVGIVGSMAPNMGANVVGINGQGASRFVRNVLSQAIDNPEDKIWLERNQTTRSNSGLAGVYEIPEELLGTNAITYWLDYGQYLYDHGVTNPKQLEFELGNAINEVYGDLANYSEFIEHELGDPGNAMEGMQARGLAVFGDVTGDANLANAARANTGNFAMDLAGQVPGLQGLIETVGRLTGNEIRSSGGIDEVINTWNMENLQSTDPSKLTARDRRISGINEDGSLKSLDPLRNPNEIKNPFLRGAEKIKQLFQTTNEFRATMAGDSIMNFISTGIEDAMVARPGDTEQARIERATKFVDELANPETISENSPFSKASKTILFNSIKEDVAQAVRTRRVEIDKAIQDYAKLTPNRQVLNTLSEALGLTPDKLLKKYQDEKTVLAQMIINKADQNGGSIPGITFSDGTPIPVDSRAFGDRVMSMISPFAGKNAKPYDHRALLLQISSKISDGVTDTLINKYHIEPEGWVYRFGDTIKKLQHLWLLGLSPSYLANNMVNNVLTRSALGYGGLLSPKAINDWTDRFGYKPERFTESMAEGILETNKDSKSSAEKMREAIRAKRKSGSKFFNKIDSKLDWVSDHMGFFGAISGKIEELESKQIYTSAMMTYMARTWKPGVNFRKMPVELENLIKAQNPEMLDAIYSAISAGVNMKEIENAIYGTYVIPSVRDTLVEAARNLGITDAEDAIIEIFDKGGVMNQLMQALNGKRGDEVDAVIKQVGKRLKLYADMKLRSDLAARAEQIAKDTKGYAFAEAIKLGQDLAQNMSDLWIESQNANTQLFDRRIREGMTGKEFHALYQEHLNELNERWAGIYAEAQQTYSGILKGLGFIDQTANKYVDKMREKDNLWADFYQKKQPELFQPYLDALEWGADDDFDKWDSRVKKAWQDYKKASNAEYLSVIKAERTKQSAMDKLFADGLKAALGNINAKKVDEVIIPLQNQIQEIRQQIIDLNLEMRSMTDATNVLNEKSQVYHENAVRREELKKKYNEAQQNLYNEIRALGPETIAPAVDSAMVEVDHEATIRNDITMREADAQQKAAEQLADLDAEDVADTEQIPDSDTTNPNNWSEVLRKKTAYKIAKELGATEEEAVAYSQLNKIHASEWEKNHPGMKYKDVGDMTVSYTDQERTVPIQGADGQLYQVEAVERADVKTPEFEAWHGNHPENFESDGVTPLSVWHGSDSWFSGYDLSKLGKNTGAPSAKLGIFTAKNKKTAEAYPNTPTYKLPIMSFDVAIRGDYKERRARFEYVRDNPESRAGMPEMGQLVASVEKEFNDTLDEIFDAFGNFSSQYATDIEAMLSKDLDKLNAAEEDYDIDSAYGFYATVKFEIQKMREALDNKDELLSTKFLRPQEKYALDYADYKIFGDINEYRDDAFDEASPYYENPDSYLNAIDYKGVIENAKNISERVSKDFSKAITKTIDTYIDLVESEYETVFRDVDFSVDDIDLISIPTKIEKRKLFEDARVLSRMVESATRSLEDAELKENFDIIRKSPEDPKIREFYLSFKNPYVVDYQGRNRADVIRYSEAIRYALANGYDAVILKNTYDGGPLDTIYVVFNENQIKSVYNKGEWSDPKNLYHQEEQQRIKGQFSIQDGKKLVELFKGSDISTLIHETMGHGWVTTLNDNQVEALAAYNGWTADRYRQLENQWYYDPESMSEADRTAWVDSQEKFAYGFEQYLLEGTAPNSAMKQIFETFKRYLLEIYHGVRHLIYKGEEIDIHKEQHGVTLADIFESMLIDSDREFAIDRTGLADVESNSIEAESYGYTIPDNVREFLITDSRKRAEKIQTMRADAEESMRLETQTFLEENKKWGLTEPELQELVTEIMHGLGLNTDLPENMDLMTSVQEKLNRFPGGEKAIKRFIEDHRETAAKINDTAMDAMLTGNNPNWRMDDTYKYVLQQVESEDQVKKRGDFVMTTKEFVHGQYTCDRVVYHNGEIVAYLPKEMEAKTIDAGNGKTAEVIGVSIEHPDQMMYVYDGEVFEEPKPQKQTENVNYGDAEDDSLGALDPEPLANHKITYEQTLPILQEFGRVYKTALNDAMANKTFGSLDAKTKEMVRQYIDQDVRADLMNTKYKTGKFGEMMRDAALLNYSKRYGFDNALTLLFPYQFWQTRSAWNWINRMGGKGGKMWRRYARLKEMEERNKKELLPSRVTGKIGIYLPFLPEWMGDALFMPTSQLSIVGNFMDPLDDWLTDNKAVNATAERYVQEAYDNGEITPEEFQTAMDPVKRAGSAVWQEMFARAQTDGDHDRDLGSLFKQYFGMSLPVSVGKALLTDNPDDWTQTPMSRTGTAFRAIFGDNIIGKGLEFAMSAPERAMRKAAVAITGNNDFRYQEFGNWGDYYIRNQVWDMVVEGKISAEQAVEACGQKDGNAIWEQAADRQRQELLQKTQLLSATMPFKKMVEDVKNGNQDKLGDDFKYLLAEVLTMWTPTSVVRSAERTWRADKAEMSKLYDTGTKADRSKFYDEHPYYTYNNLRYEDDPEQALRSYLYKSIMDRWYDLSNTEKDELKIAFGTDFQRSILSEETRAYQTMDIDQLAAYAQAMNGSIPYLATDSLNTTNVPHINTNVIPQPLKTAQETYVQEREKAHPGMADVSNIYYKLPVEDRKTFRQMNPGLDAYWQWNRQYKDAHPEVKDYQNLRSDYYNTLNAENVFSLLDPFTIKELNRAAWTKDKVRKEYQSTIERAMFNAGITDKYDDFVKILTNYVLGE